ncbi:RagB/SusD family nutrient uptake outer membrane protein [Dinghuibacter silviterrae]|uniref:Putative outer membrane starch-binding protein n=1 Tax=Dinghuibacter silviterrae TaxID=1539049 RepID=A0A4R8DHF2_9BACT|nr:RagB/SusD family nutrient uptake outer membrane protein [Dinghuibacter silviterrae]TDW96858.1 putative outer membrane starch-binding protein [Dinghuibacter silviterrae]
MKRTIASVILLASLTGCSKQLVQNPQTSLTDASFWNTPSDLSEACTYLYTFLPGLGTDDPTGNPTPAQDDYSNIGYGTGTVGVGDGSRIAPATSSEWTNFYKLIRAANNILQKSVTVTGDTGLIHQYLGEARFFRAWGYFELVKRFGDVPLVMRTLTLSDSLLYGPRTARETVIDSVYADLTYAAIYCPQPDIAQSKSEYGRVTATAALALESRVALFEGTWDKYHGGGNATAHLQIAVQAAQAVINGGKHTLFVASVPDSSYYYLFQYQTQPSTENQIVAGGNPTPGGTNFTYATNKEIILPKLYGVSLSNIISSHSYERGYLEQGNITASRGYVNAVLFKDGLPAGQSVYDSTYKQTSPLTEFRNRDPRMGMTLLSSANIWPQLQGIIPYIPGLLYKVRKYFIVQDWTNQTSFVNFLAIRYAEVLLNYAEATYELNGNISDADLNLTVNALRARATNNNPSVLPSLTNAFATANSLNLLTEIRRERTVELAFEGFHYWDELRWKTAETELPLAVEGPQYFGPPYQASVNNPILDANHFVILESAGKRSFNPARDYLWPLPTQQLALNPNLVQNPNW